MVKSNEFMQKSKKVLLESAADLKKNKGHRDDRVKRNNRIELYLLAHQCINKCKTIEQNCMALNELLKDPVKHQSLISKKQDLINEDSNDVLKNVLSFKVKQRWFDLNKGKNAEEEEKETINALNGVEEDWD